MSYCKSDGKDKSIFVTEEDLKNPEVLTELVTEDQHGIILPNGEINWDCPCLGGMTEGQCGQEFKAAFSCFHYSEEEEKGVDCIPQFKDMQECFLNYPEVYGKYSEDDDGGDGGDTKPELEVAGTGTEESEYVKEELNSTGSGSELEVKSGSGSKQDS